MLTTLKSTLLQEFAAHCSPLQERAGSKINLIAASNDTMKHLANAISPQGKSVFRDDSDT